MTQSSMQTAMIVKICPQQVQGPGNMCSHNMQSSIIVTRDPDHLKTGGVCHSSMQRAIHNKFCP